MQYHNITPELLSSPLLLGQPWRAGQMYPLQRLGSHEDDRSRVFGYPLEGLIYHIVHIYYHVVWDVSL
jgi:hypothetical protein